MELLLSRALPNVNVAASTFEDVRSEIRALGLPLWVANRYLAEAEQDLAVGRDTREVVARAKAWLATKLENPPADDSSCHVCSETGKKSCTACGTELAYMGAHGEGCPRCAEQEMDVVDALAAQEEAAAAERANLPKMQRLRMMAASPPSDLSGWGQRITDLYDIRMRPVSKLFGSRGPTPAQKAEYDAEKKFWESLNRKARAEHKRLLAASNAGLPPPPSRPSRRPSLPDPVLTRSSDAAYRSEADTLADIFNEGGVWQAEATNPNMIGKWSAPGVRLSIFSERRGPTNVVAIATINDNEVDVEWLSPDLTPASRSEITRRLRTAALTQSEDAEAPSPLQDLIASTEKRAIELGAKPARTRSFGRVTSDNADEKRLAEAVRDLRDPTEISESIKWLEQQDLGIGFDIDDRLSEMDSVSSLMDEIWTPILDTIGMEGVYTQNMRGRDRILNVATGAIFREARPFVLQRLVQNGQPTLRKVMIEIVEDSSDEDMTAFIDTEKVMTVGREQGSVGPMVHSAERGATFITLLYQYMARLREDLERAPKVLSDVRRLLYWTGAMLDAPRCQDETKRRAMESFEAAKALYDEARKRVTTQATTSSEIASIKAPLRKAAVSAAQLATDCGEGQVDIFSVRQPAPLRQTAEASGMAKRERYRQEVQAIGLPFDEQNVLMTAVDRALMFGQDADAIIARAREALVRPTLPSPDEMPSRWMSGDHVIGPNGENGTIVRLEDRGKYGWHLKLDRPPGAHWQSADGFRRVSEQSHEPPPVPPESPETPLHQQDRHSVDVLDRLVAALSQVFIVTPIRSGHGYRVVDLRSSVDFGVYKGLPRNTYLTTVSLRHSGPSEIIGDKAYLVQSTRDAGLSHDQYRAIRQFVAETVERLTDEAQGKGPPEPEEPDDGEVTTKTFATRMPTKYLRDFFAEKDIPEQHWTLRDSSGMEHHISNLVVVEHIAQTNKTEADAIANTLRRLDFANQDINGYLKHLAHALIEHKVSSVQDSEDPPVAVDAPRIFVAFSHPISPRLAAYYKPGRPGDPARFADLPALPDKTIREQLAAIDSLPPGFAEALKRYMGVIADLNMEDTVRNNYGVWQTPAIIAHVGPANVKIERVNRRGDGQLAEHGSTHTLVRRKDGAILKYGAPPASAVRGNIYKPESELRMSINHVASISRR